MRFVPVLLWLLGGPAIAADSDVSDSDGSDSDGSDSDADTFVYPTDGITASGSADDTGGCACSSGGNGAAFAVLGLGLLAAGGRRRREAR